ncbi:hypothetical protein QT329_29700 (plasmid) [Escherichia coli]|nr:hypothetical protein [Escherichia coli]
MSAFTTCVINYSFSNAIVNAFTAQSGQVRELGLSGSLTHDFIALTEQGRIVCMQINSAAFFV